ncbi:hypothetical protein [Ramlibacter sp.]|uniref:hypothetical protein n=1 Tax=Ramlibacter sp. TaxID=1917967 RepID=UPI0026103221|nr:hypothetical protein [Ramlibacter sp.]MDB5957517.1 hypothetical protein [Ramlibacter sp.]
MPTNSNAYAGQSAGTENPVLSSDWTGLSPKLIASFFPVRRVVEGTNVRWERVPGSVEVQAPVTDGNLEQTANWHSPFENQTADAKLSSLSSMFQAGGFEAILNALQAYIPAGNDLFSNALSAGQQSVQSLEGRTAVTKLNSTQVFSGMPPLKLSVTAHFRAIYDGASEVEAPMDQLMSWAVPKKLAQQGLVGNALDSSQEKGFRTMYPSEAPQIIGMSYANKLFKPLVIEGIPYPLTGPRDSAGNLIHGTMALSLASLTAIGKDDWAGFRRF